MGRVGEGLSSYYKAKIEELEIQARDKQLNLRRLEAQRNELNTKGRSPRRDALLSCKIKQQCQSLRDQFSSLNTLVCSETT